MNLLHRLFDRQAWKWRIQRRLHPLLRRNWPAHSGRDSSQPPTVAVVTVNYNTKELLAKLIFSLRRIVGQDGWLGPIVVVDNHSTDGSVEMLQALAKAKIVTPIFNHVQKYHGPGLNQGIELLAQKARAGEAGFEKIDYVAVVDSDVRMLRGDIFPDTIAFMTKQGAALVGEIAEHEGIPGGYAHVCTLLFDPAKVWRRGFSPFEEHGVPALEFQRSMVRRNVSRCSFPFTTQQYTLHLWSGTLKVINASGLHTNKYFKWSQIIADNILPSEYAIPYLLDEFDEVFRSEVPSLEPSDIVHACAKQDRIKLKRPYESKASELSEKQIEPSRASDGV